MLNFRKLNWTMVHWKAEGNSVTFVFTSSSECNVKIMFWMFYLFIEDTVDHGWHHNSRSSGEEGPKGFCNTDMRTSQVNLKIRYEPNRNELLSDESQFVIFLPEVVQQQRKPHNQGCWPDNDGQSNQGQIFFAGKRKHQTFSSVKMSLTGKMGRTKDVAIYNLLCVLDPGRGK